MSSIEDEVRMVMIGYTTGVTPLAVEFMCEIIAPLYNTVNPSKEKTQLPIKYTPDEISYIDESIDKILKLIVNNSKNDKISYLDVCEILSIDCNLRMCYHHLFPKKKIPCFKYFIHHNNSSITIPKTVSETNENIYRFLYDNYVPVIMNSHINFFNITGFNGYHHILEYTYNLIKDKDEKESLEFLNQFDPIEHKIQEVMSRIYSEFSPFLTSDIIKYVLPIYFNDKFNNFVEMINTSVNTHFAKLYLYQEAYESLQNFLYVINTKIYNLSNPIGILKDHLDPNLYTIFTNTQMEFDNVIEKLIYVILKALDIKRIVTNSNDKIFVSNKILKSYGIN